MIKQAQAQTKGIMTNVTNMDPALIETYSRLLVYTEIESLGIKGFLSILPFYLNVKYKINKSIDFRSTIASCF